MMARGKYHDWLTEEGLLKLEGWARDGLTDEQIAQNIGIAVATLYVWKNKYPEISESLKRGKEVVDRQVENALLKRALGYQYFEVTYELVEEEDGMTVERVTKRVLKEEKPDTTAAIFWLKNRKPTEWRDKQHTEISGGIDVNNPFEDLTTEELRKLAKSEKNGS
jgi:transposase